MLGKSYNILQGGYSIWSNILDLELALDLLQQDFIAQSVEHCTGIVEVMGSNPIGASELFLDFLCNCFSCFTAM